MESISKDLEALTTWLWVRVPSSGIILATGSNQVFCLFTANLYILSRNLSMHILRFLSKYLPPNTLKISRNEWSSTTGAKWPLPTSERNSSITKHSLFSDVPQAQRRIWGPAECEVWFSYERPKSVSPSGIYIFICFNQISFWLSGGLSDL